MIAWLLTNTLTAALLAGLVYAVIRVGKPAPGVRHALWLIVLLKLVSPVEFLWSVPLAVRPAPMAEESPVSIEPLPPMPAYGLVSEEFIEVPVGADAMPVFAFEDRAVAETTLMVSPSEVAPAVPKPVTEFHWEWWLLAVWVAGGAAVFARMTRDTWRFGRFARHAKKAPDELVAEVAVVANRLGLRTPAVKKLAGLASPVMWCVGRPVLLWPADLDKQVTGDGRRAVIAHELAHLRRRDHWVRRLEMLAAVAHWWNPIFWLARRRLRADAEWACDEWAAAQADRRAYAEALLAVCSFQPRRRPAPAVGVLGEGKRDMQERLTLIMKPMTPSRAAYAAKLCVCLFGLAAVPAWTLGQAPPPPKPEPAKPADPMVNLENVRIQFADAAAEESKATEDRETKVIQEQIKLLTDKLEAVRRKAKEYAILKVMQEGEAAQRNAAKGQADAQQQRAKGAAEQLAARRVPATEGDPGPQKLVAGQSVKMIGPDGKEIQGVIVIIDDRTGKVIAPVAKPLPPIAETVPGGVPIYPGFHPGWPGYKPPGWPEDGPPVNPLAEDPGWTRKPTAAPGTMTLSRATYKLPKEQAAALAALLGTVKHAVMETKADGDTLVVTTTPEAQATVQRFVWMLTGDKTYGYRAGEGVQRFMFRAGTDGKPVRIDLTEPAQPWTTELEKGLGGLRLRLDAESKPKPADVRKTEAKPAAPTAPEPTKKP